MGETHHTRAVVDRIVDDQAVLLLEDEISDGETGDGETGDDERAELIVPVTDLPEPAREEGKVLTVERTADGVCDISYDAETTATRRQRMQDKLNRLSRPLSEKDDEE